MKKISLLFLAYFSTTLYAKQLPNIQDMISRITDTNLVYEKNWKNESGVFTNANIVVNQDQIKSKLEIKGDNENSRLTSLKVNSLFCVETSLAAIDMSHHEGLRTSMHEVATNALTAYGNTSNTLVWGYNYTVSYEKNSNGNIVLTCTLK